MREIFQVYGEVTDVIIKRHMMDAKAQKGYGFVYFATVQQAEDAITDLQQNLVDGFKFDCALSQKPNKTSKSKTSNANLNSNSNFVPNLNSPTMHHPVGHQFANFSGMSRNNFTSIRDPSAHQAAQHYKRARLGKGSNHNGNPNLRLPATIHNRINHSNQGAAHNTYQMNNGIQNRMSLAPNAPPSLPPQNSSMMTYWPNQPPNPTPHVQNHSHSNYGMYPPNMNGNGWFASNSIPHHTSISYEASSRQNYPPPPSQNQMVYFNNASPGNSYYTSLPSPRPFSAVSQPPNLYPPYSSHLIQPRTNNPFLGERDGGVPQNFNYR